MYQGTCTKQHVPVHEFSLGPPSRKGDRQPLYDVRDQGATAFSSLASAACLLACHVVPQPVQLWPQPVQVQSQPGALWALIETSAWRTRDGTPSMNCTYNRSTCVICTCVICLHHSLGLKHVKKRRCNFELLCDILFRLPA